MRAFLVALLLAGHHIQAQWGTPYANAWISYGQPYVKIGILKKGLHKVAFSSLPEDFPTGSPENFQLWRRGQEVSLISTDNQEIVFYAVPNDGASDSLLYRPTSGRMNPYYSFYSDEGAYFLTVGNKPGKRAGIVEPPVDENVPLLTHHDELVTKVFQQNYSLGTNYPLNPGFFNSYFELGASRTGEVYDNGKEAVIEFTLGELAGNSHAPTIKLMLHGRSKNDRQIQLYVGKNKGALRLAKTLDNSGFAGIETAFEIKPEDLDSGKNGTVVIRSVASDPLERFSIAYYSIEYPRVLQVGNQSREWRLDVTSGKWSAIPVKGISPRFSWIDISDADNPVMLKSAGEVLMIPRLPGKTQVLLATDEVTTVGPAKLSRVNFTRHDPKATNYIIITTAELRQGATDYAAYRTSAAGGSLKPAIFEIQDIYNQFNYGEPSPVAIKKFMSYMLAEGFKDKYLFLIGKSISQNERMVRELPGEVPTIGFPASDALLVSGIAGGTANAPLIPVGRLSAISNQNIADYLRKVKAYEASGPEDSGWRKKVLHLSGGKTTNEIVQLRDYLRALEPIVQKGITGGTVKAYVKRQPTQEVESVDIAGDLNEGVGMITFFGHGGPIITDPNIGHVRDAARDYHNLNKYPLMYFNGCGVGNVFCNRFNPAPPNPKAADRITLTLDWLLAPDKGAIAVIASSYESFVNPGITYLNSLYDHLFENPATAGLPIGKIQLAVAHDILSQYKDQYNVAYVHQSVLQGDPALRLLAVADPDYAVQADEGIMLLSGSGNKTIGESDSLRVSIELANLGRFMPGQIVPVEILCAGTQGVHSKKVGVKSFASRQTLKIAFPIEKDLKLIQVKIDPDKTLKELTRDNNAAELLVDWDLVKHMQTFSNKTLKDNIPPILTVKCNGYFLKQNEPVLPDPAFSITLTDDRLLAQDTTLVDIFIKPCASDECEFERIAYAGTDIKILALEGKELTFKFSGKLGPGRYEMMIIARDRAGNEVAQPYRMDFVIARPEEMPYSLVVSPNPATSYLRFELKAAKSMPLKAVRYVICDQRGNALEEHEIPVSNLLPKLEWYWQPTRGIVPGMYSYTVQLIGAEGSTPEVRKGKVVFQ